LGPEKFQSTSNMRSRFAKDSFLFT
jgi:hypothetical protein